MIDNRNPQQLETLLQNLTLHLTVIMAGIDKLLSLENDNTVAEVNLRTTLEKLQTDGKTLEITVNDLVDVLKQDYGVGLSHELRGCVTPIMSWTEVLLMFESNNYIADGLNLREALQIIHSSCKRLSQVVTDIQAQYIKSNFKLPHDHNPE